MTPQEEIAPVGDVMVELEVELDRRTGSARTADAWAAADAAPDPAGGPRAAGGGVSGRMRAGPQHLCSRDGSGPMNFRRVLALLLTAVPAMAAAAEPLSLFGISAGKDN